ncbi:MAG: methylmalonyl Co-A mutase-associated GTPase MeaB [Deferribacteres bacterium]|nr:methylmalonyl Co-A mutase-associated GTPase MeaB [candidate division KSB1 bacterium]MCB9502142.1 methylmalonyl Co-A mutase-associated GTPase MeaB [Deferribacteres bacterium]
MKKPKKRTIDKNSPEWVPADKKNSVEFTTNIMPGVSSTTADLKSSHNQKISIRRQVKKRPALYVDDYVNGILTRERSILARAITLIESNSWQHQSQAQEILTKLMPYTGNSIRIGITGVPGAGKSSFIEAFGLYLLEQGHRVAVLAIDPSSAISGGSILGDKTRMEKLGTHPNAFIRPSPASGALGGVARKTRETLLVCEASGFDVVLVETVGVGQSEITVRSLVDFFLLLQIAGGGDELQGIKKGVMEIADALVVNKADGDNKAKAEVAKQGFATALHYMMPHTNGWQTRAFTCSAVTGEGIANVWRVIEKFKGITTANNVFAERRRSQARQWMRAIVEDYLQSLFYKDENIQKILPQLENAVMAGKIPATTAAQQLVDAFEKQREK